MPQLKAAQELLFTSNDDTLFIIFEFVENKLAFCGSFLRNSLFVDTFI